MYSYRCFGRTIRMYLIYIYGSITLKCYKGYALKLHMKFKNDVCLFLNKMWQTANYSFKMLTKHQDSINFHS